MQLQLHNCSQKANEISRVNIVNKHVDFLFAFLTNIFKRFDALWFEMVVDKVLELPLRKFEDALAIVLKHTLKLFLHSS
jgi:hypothetical protein